MGRMGGGFVGDEGFFFLGGGGGVGWYGRRDMNGGLFGGSFVG